MAEFTVIPDANLEPDKPARSIDALAFYANPIAIAEGAAGAPRIQTAAIQDGAVTSAKLATGTGERDWVLARTAGAATGAVGTYSWLAQSAATTTNITAGTTYAGSGLRYFGYNGTPGGTVIASSYVGTPSGTWRAMGASDISATAVRHTLFLRIS